MSKSIKTLMILTLITASCISEREAYTNNVNMADMRPEEDQQGDQAPKEDMKEDMRQDMRVDMGPCGTCESGTVCDTSSKQCVQCLSNAQCTSGAANICDNNSCVQCASNDDCQDASATVCASNKCVQCEGNAECQDPNASLCTDNACAGCNTNADCSHLGATPVCDSGAKVCVGCTPSTEANDCAGNSCDPATKLCTSTPLKMTDTCQACVSDSECLANHRCVPLKFMGNDAGSFCLQTKATAAVNGFCPRVFPVVVSRVSLSGAAAEEYCAIAEELATCQAVREVLDFDPGAPKTCTQDTDCGRNDVGDGACELIAGGMRCTYRCSANAQCDSASMLTCLPRTNDANQRVCK